MQLWLRVWTWTHFKEVMSSVWVGGGHAGSLKHESYYTRSCLTVGRLLPISGRITWSSQIASKLSGLEHKRGLWYSPCPTLVGWICSDLSLVCSWSLYISKFIGFCLATIDCMEASALTKVEEHLPERYVIVGLHIEETSWTSLPMKIRWYKYTYGSLAQHISPLRTI
jgi:hypothetical protein